MWQTWPASRAERQVCSRRRKYHGDLGHRVQHFGVWLATSRRRLGDPVRRDA